MMRCSLTVVALWLVAATALADVFPYDAIGTDTTATDNGEPILSMFSPGVGYVIAAQPVTFANSTTLSKLEAVVWSEDAVWPENDIHWGIFSSLNAFAADPLHPDVFAATTGGTLPRFSTSAAYGLNHYLASLDVNCAVSAGTYVFSIWGIGSDTHSFALPESKIDLGTAYWKTDDDLPPVPVKYDETFMPTGTMPLRLTSFAVSTVAWLGGDASHPTNWDIMGNWAGGSIPDGPGCRVSFGNQAANNNVVDMISAGKTVGAISFTDGISTTLQSSGGFSLTLDNNGQRSTIDVSGNHTISAPLLLRNDALYSGPGTLDCTAGISGSHSLYVTNGTLNTSSIVVDTLNIGDEVHSVPEPATWILLATSLLLPVYAGCRHRQTGSESRR